MFRDYEIRYVITSVAVAWLITTLLTSYEVFINRSDTGLQTAVASTIGMAAAVGITLLLVGTWEVFMVLARRLNERRLDEAKKEGLKEGKEEGLKEGKEEGLKEGKEEGLKEGKEEGMKEGKVEGLKTERKRWQAWYDSLPAEIKNQQLLPPPSEGNPW